MSKNFQLLQMRAMRAHAEIISGAYKFAQTQQCDSSYPGGWRPFTDEEKLKNKIDEMNRHISLMQEQLDYIAKED